MAGKTSRPKRASDELYNIRRRFKRAASRYERQAKSAGSETERRQLLAAAGEARKQAESLRFRNITQATDRKARAQAVQAAISRYRRASLDQLASSAKNEQERRDQLAKSILQGSKGSTFYASTIDAWRDVAPDQRNEAIVAYFREALAKPGPGREPEQVRDLLDVITILERETQVPYLDPTKEENDFEGNYRAATRRALVFMSEFWD